MSVPLHSPTGSTHNHLFWMVFAQGKGAPLACHDKEEIAWKEADRIARKENVRCYVMKAIGVVEPKNVTTWADITDEGQRNYPAEIEFRNETRDKIRAEVEMERNDIGHGDEVGSIAQSVARGDF